jgi:hypothetical protein
MRRALLAALAVCVAACQTNTVATACDAPLKLCGNACTNPSSDAANCGGCGTACGPAQVCRAGLCAASATPTPDAKLVSPSPTAGKVAVVQLNSCDGLGSVLTTLSSAGPGPADAGWGACTLAPLSVSLPAEGAASISVWGMSPEGHISSAAKKLDLTVDRSAPTGVLSGLAASVGADAIVPATLTIADATGISSLAIEASADGATLWRQLAATSTPVLGANQLPLTLPPSAGTWTLRLRASDTLGNGGVSPLGTLAITDCEPTALPFGGGRGTVLHPWRLCSEAQLRKVQTQMDAEYTLWADLALTAPLQLGYKSHGAFDGQEHLVSHLVINHPSAGKLDYDVGLFSGLGLNGDATVKNLRVQIDSITAPNTANVGGLVGHVFPTGHIENCQVTLSGAVTGLSAVGGLAGFVQGSITGSKVAGGANASVACGPLAVPRDATNNNCCDPGSVGGAVGGVFGGALSFVEVSGPLQVGCTTPVTSPIGGLAGAVSPQGSITDASAEDVTVQGPAQALGGLVGAAWEAGPPLQRLQASRVRVSCGSGMPANAAAGGLVGGLGREASDLHIEDSDVRCDAPVVGGAVGFLGNFNAPSFTASRLAALRTDVTGRSQVGGLVGSLAPGVTLQDATVAGSPIVRVTGNPGQPLGGVVGLVGGANSAASITILRTSSDARLAWPGGAQLWGVGGIAGGAYANGSGGITIDQAASRAVLLVPAAGGDLSMVGGLVGEIGGNSTAAVVVRDSYSDLRAPTTGVGFAGGIVGQIDSTTTPQLVRVLAYGAAPANMCLTGTTPPTLTQALWNSSACTQQQAPAGGTGLSPATLSTLSGTGFTAPVWTEGPQHPLLSWEP